jgi:cytochrome c-type biogenesis protein CcmH/NrfG
LQTEGLIEPFVQESLTAQHQQLVASKQRNKRQRSWMLKGFTITTIALAGLAAWGGYSIGTQWTIDAANQAAQSAQNTLSEKNKNLETKVGELEGQIKIKDEQIRDLISKITTVAPNNPTPMPSASSSP